MSTPHARLVLVLASLSLSLAAAPGCLREGRERARADLEVGQVALAEVALAVDDGLAHVRALTPGSDAEPGAIDLWGSAPDFRLSLRAPAGSSWLLTLENAMPDAELHALGDADGLAIDALEGPRPTVRRWSLRLAEDPGQPGAERALRLRVAPPDADARASAGQPWRFAVMGDIQRALPEVDDIFALINEDPSVRFVASTGDLVDGGEHEEYELLEEQLALLEVPYFSTIGNHELFGPAERWSSRFGRFNLHFRFKGAAFSLIDSGNSSIDPMVYDWLGEWAEDARDDVHFFFTHFPAVDPVGVRAGSLRSSSEARKLLAVLAEGAFDVTFYGHIHSYYAFENAGIPAFISGGGGAIPERWDGIGRHFLTVDVGPEAVRAVSLVRVE